MVVRFLYVLFCFIRMQLEEKSDFAYELRRDIKRLQEQLQDLRLNDTKDSTMLPSKNVDNGVQTLESLFEDEFYNPLHRPSELVSLDESRFPPAHPGWRTSVSQLFPV